MTSFHKKMRLQSAMEFLMTYGWAILIIAVVLGTLYTLGVFNSSTYTQKATAGSCNVYRPNGPGTTFDMNLVGTCVNEQPQFVAQLDSLNDYMSVNKEYFKGNSFTILAWVYWPSGTNLAAPGTPNGDLGYAWSGPGVMDEGFGIFSRDDNWYLNFFGDDLECAGHGPTTGKWYQFGASWNSTTKVRNVWVDGAVNCTGSSAGSEVTGSPLEIGSGAGTWDAGAGMDGSLANIQIYNASLPASVVSALYIEGIGGQPIQLQNLVGWWPLNQNENDYSGNNNDGSSNTIFDYTNQWTTGYTPP